ncbi:MAG: (2Fe-2S)-binding protein [Deinococcus sp.]|nr:(2Fe-2S)-binding protein [Deinococcus sp.]
MNTIQLTINGKPCLATVEEDTTLMQVLRDQFRLTGVKEGCTIGLCGSCTVLLDNKVTRSCMLEATRAAGKSVLTVEGLGTPENLHPIQQAFIDCGAVQCGFCIPGLIMAAKYIIDKNPTPSREEIRRGISTNHCRCTGYVQIVDAIELAAQRMRGELRLTTL